MSLSVYGRNRRRFTLHVISGIATECSNCCGYYVLSRVLVTVDGVWIGNWIY
jgi:hypothetical protein